MDRKQVINDIILALIMFVLMMSVTFVATSKRVPNEVFATDTDADPEREREKWTASPSGTTTSTTTATTESDMDSDDNLKITTEQITVDMGGLSAEEIARLTSELTDTLKEKNELQSLLNNMMDSQNDFIKKLNELDDMIIEYQDKLDEIEEKTALANKTLTGLQESIDEAKAEQDVQYELVKRHIQQEYENGSYSYLDAIFDSIDYTDIVNKTEYIQAIERYDEQILQELIDSRQLLDDKKALLTMLTEDMDVLAEAYQNKQDSILIISNEKETQIKNYQSSIDSVQSQVASLEALEQQMNAQISSVEASYNASLTSNVIYSGAQFLWPMPTSSTISSYYGPRTAPTAGATSYHRGIDIPCAMGSNVIAVADGTVIYVGYLGNGGNCVIVDHGSGISTCYFHLSAFNCSVGDAVTAGQVICYSGNTGVSTGPHLHFAVRENGEYVNPLKYYTMIQDQSAEASSD